MAKTRFGERNYLRYIVRFVQVALERCVPFKFMVLFK